MGNKKDNLAIRTARFVVDAARSVLPPFDVLCVYIFAKRDGNRIVRYNPVSFKKYCTGGKGRITTVEKSGERMVYEPAYFDKCEGRIHKFKSPDIYIAELHDVYVHGASGLVSSSNYAVTDICAQDKEDRVNYTFGGIKRGTKKKLYVQVSKEIGEVDEAINLCGLASFNYYHLTIEILSRYEFVKEYAEKNNIPVLLDEDAALYPQFRELVDCVLGNARVIYVPKYKRIRVGKLIQPSMNTWMPMNVRKKNDFRISDNLIAVSAVENIRKAAKEMQKNEMTEKIFISRKNASLSRIINEKEIIKVFEKHGYRIVCTEELSFSEQVELFSGAKIIAGASGAALTNLIYCNKGAVVGCVIPQKYNFCI